MRSILTTTLLKTAAATAAVAALAAAPAFAQSTMGYPVNTTTGTPATNGSKMDGTSNKAQESPSGIAASGAMVPQTAPTYATPSDGMAYNNGNYASYDSRSSNGMRSGYVSRDNSPSAWGDSGAGQISRGEAGSGKTTAAKSRS